MLCDHKWRMDALTELSLRLEAQGFPLASTSMTSGYFHGKQTRKRESKASTNGGTERETETRYKGYHKKMVK